MSLLPVRPTRSGKARRWQVRHGSGGPRRSTARGAAARHRTGSAPQRGQLRPFYRDMVLDPPVRGTRRPGLHRGARRRLLPPQPGRGSGRGRPHGGAAANRLPLHQLPRARLRAHARHRPEPGDGRAVRPGRRRLQGLGRLDAHVRRHPPAARRLRHRRRPAAAGDRRGAGHRLPGRRRGGDVHPGRRHHRHRRLPRVAEHRRAVEPAGRLRHHQQRARHGHARSPARRPSRTCTSGAPPTGWSRRGSTGSTRSPSATRRRRPSRPRAADRPYLLEVVTERLRGHSVVDPAKYRQRRGDRAAQARGPGRSCSAPS